MKIPRKGMAVLAAIFIVCLLVVVAGESYWTEMSTITDTSEGTADMRLELWKIALNEFLAYPLTGVGAGNFKWRLAEFQSPEQVEKFGRLLSYETHSTFFQLLAELGLAGCIVFGMILFYTYRNYQQIDKLSSRYLLAAQSSLNPQAEDDLRWIQAYGWGLMGGFLGYLASVMFISSLYYSHTWIPGAMMIALYLITAERIKRQDCQAFQLEDAK